MAFSADGIWPSDLPLGTPSAGPTIVSASFSKTITPTFTVSGTVSPSNPSFNLRATPTFNITAVPATSVPAVKNNFDGGTNGATITTANAGGVGNTQFDAVIRDPSAVAMFYNGAAHGTLSLQLETASTPGIGAGVRWTTAVGAVTTIFIRFNLFMSVNPNVPWRVFSAFNVGGGFGSAGIEVQVDGRLSVRDSFSDVIFTNKSINIGAWVRIEAKIVSSQTAGQIELRFFNSMESTIPDETIITAANRWIYGPMGTFDFGHTSNIRGNFGPAWFDDVATSTVDWIGPVKSTPGASPLLIIPTFTVTSVRTLVGSALLIVTPTLLLTSRQPLQGVTLSLTLNPLLYIVGATPANLPTDIYVRHPYPAPQEFFRIIAQEILTGKIVDWDLPVQNDFSYTTQLSGPTTMQGAFLPEINSVQELGLDGFAYFFHVEIAGDIRATGIFLPPEYQETGFAFTAEGFSSISYYVTWGGLISATSIDPLDVVRLIWKDVQNNPRSNLGIVISDTTSNKRLGLPAYTEIVKTLQESGVTTTSMNEVAATPYELLWWNSPNCGETLDNLATETPFDYRERVKWNATKTQPELYVDYGYPRIGVPRDKLLFNEENVLEIVPIQELDNTYASEVLVIGAGEGSATIRGYAAENFGNRVRKMQVITDKTIISVARANAVAATELGLRKGSVFSLDELVVLARHQNATIGEYDIGDDIYVQVDIPWLPDPHRAWYRIISITYEPAREVVRLKVARSDSFTYSDAPTTGPPIVTDDVLAAQAIMDRHLSGEDIFEDWTWAGCPAYVSAQNDNLLNAYDHSGYTNEIAWLQDYILARV